MLLRGGLGRIAGLVGFQLGLSLHLRPRLGQHDGHAAGLELIHLVGNKMSELVGFKVDVPVAVARLRQLRGLPQRGCDAHGFAVGLAQLFHTRPIQTLRRHRPRRIRARAYPHAHRPLGCIRVIVKRFLHDVDQLELYLVDGVLPLIEPAQKLRASTPDRPRIEQRAGEFVPWHRPRCLRHGPQLVEGNPMRQLIGHIIR